MVNAALENLVAMRRGAVALFRVPGLKCHFVGLVALRSVWR